MMYATPRIRTPLPPRPVVASAAVECAHRLLAALIDRDLGGAEALFAPEACVWWSQRGGLSTIEGPGPLARALVELLEGAPPTRLSVVPSAPESALACAFIDDAVVWTLELRIEGPHFVGAYVRGAQRH